jgi:transcriptional regulator with XRE-family HTH domain
MARIGFGEVLRRLRHDRGETLEQVSEATGLSVAMLSRVERGERLPSPDSVEMLAEHFGLPVEYLMSETIANRMLNRYGLRSSSLAAERMSREPAESLEFGMFDVEPLSASGAGDQPEDQPESPGRQSERPPRRYGVFQEIDMLAALADIEVPVGSRRVCDRSTRLSRRLRPHEERSSPSQPPAGPDSERTAAALELSAPEPAASQIDPATEQVLRAATVSSAAAAVLALREARSLPPDARLELLREVEALAGQAADVLRMLARDDPDDRVRTAAGQALRRLGRH